MNNFKKFILLVNCTFLFFTVSAQNSHSPLEDIANAMKGNRIADLEKYFDNFVPITINNSQSVYGHNQAEIVLRDFFEKNSPRDFTVMDNGSPNSTSKFMIGTFLTYPNGKYNVYILLKMKDNAFLIQEIRMNKE
jgi:hypothetical protein